MAKAIVRTYDNGHHEIECGSVTIDENTGDLIIFEPTQGDRPEVAARFARGNWASYERGSGE